jgi:hypothetical protein
LIKSAVAVHKGRTSRFTHVDDHLARILSSLAQLLLKHGYGYPRLAKLAKIAFVDAARALGPKRNSKVNIARVATLTGLTRVEVSRILREDRSIPTGDDQLNRATRVAIGWQSDPAYLNRSKRPRPLQFSARSGGFGQLVRKYSGDIPARAMLTEMSRLGLVTLDNSGLISLIRDIPALPPSTIATISAIAPWVNLVADAGGSLASNAMSSHAQQIRIYFNSLSEVIAASRDLQSRQRSFVAGIQQLGTTHRKIGNYEVTVSVAVATTRPLRSNQKKK